MREQLQSRLVTFAGMCISIRKYAQHSFEGDHLSKQLIRSATSAALNYGESQSAQSKKDFIHKQSLSLKELRESYINLLILEQNELCKRVDLIRKALDEANQLVSIFVISVRTAMKNNKPI
jgi:four helix bundle protein